MDLQAMTGTDQPWHSYMVSDTIHEKQVMTETNHDETKVIMMDQHIQIDVNEISARLDFSNK